MSDPSGHYVNECVDSPNCPSTNSGGGSVSGGAVTTTTTTITQIPTTAEWILEYHWSSLVLLLASYIQLIFGDTLLGPIAAALLSTSQAVNALSGDWQKVLNTFGTKNKGLELSTIATLASDALNWMWNVADFAMKTTIVGAFSGNYGLAIITGGGSEAVEEDMNAYTALGTTIALTTSLTAQYDYEYHLNFPTWVL